MKKYILFITLLSLALVAQPVQALSAIQESARILPANTPDPKTIASENALFENVPMDVSIQEMQDDGFTLAIFTMFFMLVSLVYTLLAFMLGKPLPLPAWADWLIPATIVLGIGVAGYLSYIEIEGVAAICGPVGNCNAVQSSPYATLFGFLPIGVLGLLGYIGLLVAWLARKFIPRFEKIAALAFLSMSVFAVIFSLYLTYLEPFVINAVCIWCITSAWLVTFLLLLGFPPAARLFVLNEENE